MEIILKDRIAAKLEEELKQWHIEREEPNRYGERGKRAPRPDVQVDLSKMSKEECQRFMELLEGCGIVGTKILAADIRKYLKAAETGDVEGMQARTVRQASWMLEHFFAALPHHVIFSHDAYGGRSHTGYYVSDVDYEPAKKGDSREHAVPARCTIKLVWMEDEQREVSEISFSDEGCLGRTPREILTGLGHAPETPELMAKLVKETERYYWARELVGTQFVAGGVGVVDLDDASARREIDGWFTTFGRSRKLKLNHFGIETRVVVDVLEEKDDVKRDRDRDKGFDPYRWHSWNLKFFTQNEDEVAKHLEADEDTAERPEVEVPVHPLVPCFDLRRHLRMRIHVNNIEKYAYNRDAAKNLVLPDRDWRMINLLVDQSKNSFQDVVAGKGASMNVLAEGPPGTGKCLGAGTLVLLYNGRIISVENVQVGDLLMGPDSKPRRVLGLARGKAQMYKIQPVKGESWTCNDVHMMTLTATRPSDYKQPTVDVPLNRYLAKCRRLGVKPDGDWKLLRVGVEWPKQPVPFDPYFIGLWLGDGDRKGPCITNAEPEVKRYIESFTAGQGLLLKSTWYEKNGSYEHRLGIRTRNQSNPPQVFPLRRYLRSKCVEGGKGNGLTDGIKKVPDEYLVNDRPTRLNLLAGLVDSDGHLSCGGYEVVARDRTLADQIAFLARSLGFAAHVGPKVVNDVTYNRIFISGNVAEIPCRVTRKQAKTRSQNKRVNVTGWSAKSIGFGDYYGFTLDGDGRFLLGDFTVTHNTVTAEVFAEFKERPLYTIQCSQLGTSPEKVEANLAVALARANRWNAILLLDEADVYIRKRGADLEQNAIVGVFLRLLEFASCILFMTTNLPDNVDDAIASRCIARLHYGPPTVEDQVKIWMVLSRLNGIPLTEGDARSFARRHPAISGRDVKNLLKLASFVAQAEGKPLTLETLEYVLQFKPTEDSYAGFRLPGKKGDED